MRCLIFDFDGTLADTNAAIVKTYQETFRVMGLPVPTAEQVTPTIGLVSEKIFPILLPGIDPERIEEGVKINRKLFYEVGVPLITMFEGVTDVLSCLRERGIRMAIASSRNTPSLEFIVDKLAIRQYFDEIAGAGMVERHKPAPDMALLICKDLCIQPGDAMVIGDTVFDLGMGINAGCRTCGVTYGNHSREKLSGAGPDWLIDDFSELIEIVETWTGENS